MAMSVDALTGWEERATVVVRCLEGVHAHDRASEPAVVSIHTMSFPNRLSCQIFIGDFLPLSS